MPPSKFFRVDRDGNTLIAVTLREITSLADEDLEEELEHLQRELEQPEVKNLVMDFGQVSYLESCTVNPMVGPPRPLVVAQVGERRRLLDGVEGRSLEITKFD